METRVQGRDHELGWKWGSNRFILFSLSESACPSLTSQWHASQKLGRPASPAIQQTTTQAPPEHTLGLRASPQGGPKAALRSWGVTAGRHSWASQRGVTAGRHSGGSMQGVVLFFCLLRSHRGGHKAVARLTHAVGDCGCHCCRPPQAQPQAANKTWTALQCMPAVPCGATDHVTPPMLMQLPLPLPHTPRPIICFNAPPSSCPECCLGRSHALPLLRHPRLSLPDSLPLDFPPPPPPPVLPPLPQFPDAFHFQTHHNHLGTARQRSCVWGWVGGWVRTGSGQ